MTKYEESLKVMKQQREEAGQAFLGVVQFNVPQYYAVIEAIEKQIPKKPNYEYEQTGNGISSVIRFPICPSCNGIDDGEQYSAGVNEKFCCICGQALDWSDWK